MTLQKHDAIQTALDGNWDTAISINQEILRDNPQDTETLNRLAFAFTVVGKIKDAKQTYQKVLEIDIVNPIALRNLQRLGTVSLQSHVSFIQISHDMFIEEHGKTKIVNLINTATPKLLKTLQIGLPVKLSIKRSKIFVLDEQDTYIGMLSEDLGKRLIEFIKGGNVYEAYIKSCEQHNVAIFIREKKKATKFKNQSSFLFADRNHTTQTNGKKFKQHYSPSFEDEA